MSAIDPSNARGAQALSRRTFLRGAACAGLYGALPESLWSRVLPAAPAGEGRLVLVRLEGGNDALNTLFPRENDAYRKARPKLAQKGGVPLDDTWALHASMQPLRELWDTGRLALFPGIGYPQPDRSHFRSMDIWETARPEKVDVSSGWLGRALDALLARDEKSGPLACALGTARLPLALLARTAQSACADEVEELAGDFELDPGTQDLLRAVHGGSGEVATSVRTWLAARERLEQLPQEPRTPKNRIARDLHGVARLLRADLGARVFHVSMSGFDTHARQADVHGAQLAELAGALRELVRELERDGLYERTTVLVFSEFGRRVRENGSLGTDHGAGGLALLYGGRVRGGIRSSAPSLEDLDDGDLKHTLDFRAVYSALLREVLGVEDAELSSAAGTPLQLLEA